MDPQPLGPRSTPPAVSTTRGLRELVRRDPWRAAAWCLVAATFVIGSVNVAFSPLVGLMVLIMVRWSATPSFAPDDLADIAPDPMPKDHFPVQIRAFFEGLPVGTDEGILAFFEGWIYFVGRHSTFSVRRADAEDAWVYKPLEAPGGYRYVLEMLGRSIAIRPYPKARFVAGDLRARFDVSFVRWSTNPDRLPHRATYPMRVLQPWSRSARRGKTAVGVAAIILATMLPSAFLAFRLTLIAALAGYAVGAGLWLDNEREPQPPGRR